MRTKLLLAALVMAVFAVAMFAGPAAAASGTINAGGTLTDEVTVNDGDEIEINWQSSATVSLTMRDPDNAVVLTASGSSYDNFFNMYEATKDGVYTLVWTNSNSNAVTITYSVTALPFSGPDGIMEGISDFILFTLIAAIVIIVVIVVVVILVVMRGKKPAQQAPQMMYAPPQGPPPPMQTQAGGAPMAAATTGTCPRCGAVLDPSGAFCQKCGARVR